MKEGTLTQDANGRPWGDYSAEEATKELGYDVGISDGQDLCSAGLCKRPEDTLYRDMAEGEPCGWKRTSYEYDEWDAVCLPCIREEFITIMTTDWEAMGRDALSSYGPNAPVSSSQT